ncbi:MAG TPA: PAS domain S-box protein, partial [Pelobium sp.]|nr:PAS domain S-box protein [Pelobium sp.]
MAPSMINNNEQERLATLKGYQILDTLPKEAFDRFTKLAAIICDVPISLVSLIDENRQWFKSQVGLEVKETPRKIAFCNHTIRDDKILEIEDATNDFRFKDNPLVTSSPNIKFYAGFPLVDPNGYALGTLCVIDTKPNKLSETQKNALKLLAKSVIDLIVLQRKIQEIENFDKLFQISKDLICVLSPNGEFANTNNAFKRLFGWKRSELANKSFFDYVHPDDLKLTKEKIHKLATGAATVSFAHRFIAKDNTYKVLEWVATPEPSTKMYFAIARDITDAKEKEIALHHSEQKLRAFFENSTSFMCTHDLEGNLITVNSSGTRSLGYSKEELIGTSLFKLMPENREEYIKQYLSEIKTKGKVNGLMRTQHKNGKTLIWLFNNVLETEPNGEKYVIGNAIDISERYALEADLKRTKEMMEQTNDAAKIGAWEVDLKTKKIYWSPITKKLHEVDDDYEPDFETGVSLFGEDGSKIKEAFEKAVSEGVTYNLEAQVTTAKGNTLWIRTIGTPEFKEGECIRVYGTFQDITENYLHRIALKKAKTQAEEASVAKSEFLASMSHEIRTPLNGVIGFTDLVLKTSLNQTQHQYLTIVNQSANALLAIINDILDFSKIEAGKLELDIEKSDLFELTSQACDIITFQAQNKGLEVLLNIDPNLPRYVFIDDTRLKQVLINLLGNAIKFTEQGEIELKISAESDLNNEYIDFC